MTVYFAEVEASSIVKIGCTSGCVQRRLGNIRREHGLLDPPALIGTMPGGRSVEQKIHRILSRYRVQGEWFFLDEPVRGFIDTCIEKKDIELARAVHGDAIRAPGEACDHRLHEWASYQARGLC